MADTDAGPFTIRELDGDNRTLELRQRCLPYRPVSFDVEQAHERTRLAGSPIATIQVFGPDDKDTTCHGFWKDIFIGDPTIDMAVLDGGVVTTARDLTVIVEDMTRKGVDVEVSWMHESRRGIIGSFKKNWHNLSDVEWELTFVWEGHTSDFTPGPVEAVSTTWSLGDLVGQLDTQVADLVDKAAPISTSPLAAVTDAKNAILRAQATVNDLADQVVDAAHGATAPLAAALRAAASFQGAVLNTGDALTSFYARVERAAFGFVSDDVGASVAATLANREAVGSARAARVQAARARRVLLLRANPDLIAAFVARQDDDLRQVSLQFYRDASSWRKLATFNGVESSRLVAGQVVFVPRTVGAPT